MKKNRINQISALVLPVVAALPAAVWAHPGHGQSDVGAGALLHGMSHALSGIDHLAIAVAAGLWAGRWAGPVRLAAAAVVAAMTWVGAVWAGSTGLALAAGPGLGAAALVLALVSLSGPRLGRAVALSLVAVAAALVGLSHGAATDVASGLGFAIGASAAAAAVAGVSALAGAALVAGRQQGGGRSLDALQWAGVACALLALGAV
jgi:hydrogenase/urease accessory protein HupE